MTDIFFHASLPSPLGALSLVFDDSHLVALQFEGSEGHALDRLARFAPGFAILAGTPPRAIIEPLQAYFAGDLQALHTIPLREFGSDFDKRVWAGLRAIGVAETWSYAQLAAHVSSAPRAVGGANGRNPIAIVTPCHRVIAADGGLGGYSGELWRKQWLLDHETKHKPVANRSTIDVLCAPH